MELAYASVLVLIKTLLRLVHDVLTADASIEQCSIPALGLT